jgi:hypothetical protein
MIERKRRAINCSIIWFKIKIWNIIVSIKYFRQILWLDYFRLTPLLLKYPDRIRYIKQAEIVFFINRFHWQVTSLNLESNHTLTKVSRMLLKVSIIFDYCNLEGAEFLFFQKKPILSEFVLTHIQSQNREEPKMKRNSAEANRNTILKLICWFVILIKHSIEL